MVARAASQRCGTITPMPATHFTPWQSERRPCWFCAHFAGMLYGGSAARCSLANSARVRSMPSDGCSGFEREVGADDEPDQGPMVTAPALPGFARPG